MLFTAFSFPLRSTLLFLAFVMQFLFQGSSTVTVLNIYRFIFFNVPVSQAPNQELYSLSHFFFFILRNHIHVASNTSFVLMTFKNNIVREDLNFGIFASRGLVLYFFLTVQCHSKFPCQDDCVMVLSVFLSLFPTSLRCAYNSVFLIQILIEVNDSSISNFFQDEEIKKILSIIQISIILFMIVILL